jgi:hypothetical protein
LQARLRLRKALAILLARDTALLSRNAAERTVAARLALYLSALFPAYDVDVEYNRHGLDPKDVTLPITCRGGGRKLIVPDIIIHHRGSDDANLLVIELKKSTNHEPHDCDRAKIVAMKREYRYTFGVFIVLPAGPASRVPHISELWL